jgi:hypothetical protein
MKEIKIFIVLLFACLICLNSYSQSESQSTFVVITFSSRYKTTMHGRQDYFWIIPIDSLSKIQNNLSRLFIEPISQTMLLDCQKRIPLDPRLIFQNAPNDISNVYIKQLDFLKNVIMDNKKEILSITKKWANGQIQKINVYATPIKGKFCFSLYHPISQDRTDYKGLICLPISEFSLAIDFWSTEQAQSLLVVDFSKFEFDLISN